MPGAVSSPFEQPVARRRKSCSPESAFRVKRGIHHVGGFGVEHAPELAGPAAAATGRPGGLVRVRGPVRAAHLRLVPAAAAPGRRRPRRDPERAPQVGGQDALVSLRSVGQLPRLAEDRDTSRLERLRDRPATAGPRQRQPPGRGVAAASDGGRRTVSAPEGRVRSGSAGGVPAARAGPCGRAHVGGLPTDGPGGPLGRRGRRRPGHDRGRGFQGQVPRAQDAPGRSPRTRRERDPVITCPSRAQLDRMLAERLPEEEEDELASHLESCPVCQQILEELTAAPVSGDSLATPFAAGASNTTAVDTPAPNDATNLLDANFRRHLQEQLATEAMPQHLAVLAWERKPAPGTLETELPVIAGYQILKEVGRGGMGVVYKARHVKLNRLVALKMILADEFAPAPHLSRFLVEGEMIARLQHPNIVQIYQVGQHRGRPFFELEYVAGGTLAGLLRNNPLPPATAVRLVGQLANAVQYAHSQGIIHRDLKPANVLLQKDESQSSSLVPKIADFGLAKQVQLRSDLTTTGMVVGTPSYMAPEQVEASRNVGPAADIHALGAILYELLTGRPPFKADSPLTTAFQVIHEEPTPPGRLRPQVAVDLETICLKCLKKHPQERYRSAAELEDDLGRFQRGEPIRARAVGWRERLHKWARRRPALAGLLATLAVLAVTSFAVITWLWNQAEIKAIAEAKANSKAQEHALREQQARQELERQRVGIVLDQGQRLAAAGDVGQGMLQLARALELAVEGQDPGLERVARINLASWQQQLVMRRGQFKHRDWVWAAAFSPDSQTVVAAGKDKVARRWSVTSGKQIEPSLAHAYPIWRAHFSPDGRFLLTVGGDESPNSGDASLWNAATGAPIHNSSLVHKTLVGIVAFHPDGKVFLTAALNDGARLWNTATCQQIGPVLKHPGLLAARFSPTGRWLVTAGVDGVVRLWEMPSG